MCKCYQSLIDSCYWHCFGKWGFDESIALYEDQISKKSSRVNDNLAFWDSVSVIANRSVVTIQPLTEKHGTQGTTDNPITPLCEIKINGNISLDEFDSSKVELRSKNKDPNLNMTDEEKYIKISDNGEKGKFRKKSAMEDKIDKRAMTPNPERVRKKSLKDRRNSTADLTLKLDQDFHEIPVIRHNSMPKFFLDYTPEYNPFSNEPSNILVSPVLPNTPCSGFDLSSVVQIENEIEHAQHVINAKRHSSRMANIRRKMKPILIKKPSTKSLPDAINHL